MNRVAVERHLTRFDLSLLCCPLVEREHVTETANARWQKVSVMLPTYIPMRFNRQNYSPS